MPLPNTLELEKQRWEGDSFFTSTVGHFLLCSRPQRPGRPGRHGTRHESAHAIDIVLFFA